MTKIKSIANDAPNAYKNPFAIIGKILIANGIANTKKQVMIVVINNEMINIFKMFIDFPCIS